MIDYLILFTAGAWKKFFRLVRRVHSTYFFWATRHHYLVSSTNRVYRVPAHITPDLINLYREARNQYRSEWVAESPPASDEVSGYLASMIEVDDLMNRLGFKAIYQAKPIEVEV